MSQHVFHVYRFEPYTILATPIHFEQSPFAVMQSLATRVNSTSPSIRQNSDITPFDLPASQPATASIDILTAFQQNMLESAISEIPPWKPSTRLRAMQTRFENTILYQHICVPCVYCGLLLYP